MKAYFPFPESPPPDPLPTVMVTLNKDYSVYYWVTFWITENSQFWMTHWRAHCTFFLHSVCSLLCFRRTNWNHQLNILREVNHGLQIEFSASEGLHRSSSHKSNKHCACKEIISYCPGYLLIFLNVSFCFTTVFE